VFASSVKAPSLLSQHRIISHPRCAHHRSPSPSSLTRDLAILVPRSTCAGSLIQVKATSSPRFAISITSPRPNIEFCYPLNYFPVYGRWNSRLERLRIRVFSESRLIVRISSIAQTYIDTSTLQSVAVTSQQCPCILTAAWGVFPLQALAVLTSCLSRFEPSSTLRFVLLKLLSIKVWFAACFSSMLIGRSRRLAKVVITS
jgi:hypothetical protein